ncbi:putative matrix protein [Formica fusca virus 1]|uniref:Putative matrix protein n=1 Tax=Formica fusca virus 1 TaxID=2018499 RepID=A0A3G5FMB0_9MONO|nr:putative matrix protein [Formica fusca virus 1]AYW51536.1 putative matrix protein [Formica fusca virus 1]
MLMFIFLYSYKKSTTKMKNELIVEYKVLVDQITQINACDKIPQIIKVDLEQATGAAKWELTGRKVLLYVKEYLQPEAKLYTNISFLRDLQNHGQTPASTLLVSNRTSNEMHNLSATGDDSGIADTSADADECASALHNLNLRRGRGGTP